MTTDLPAADFPPPDGIKPVVGMIHVGALPGTPRHHRSLREIVDEARAEARLYHEAGVNCLMIENMHDVPYTRGGVGPEIVAAMTMAAQAVRAEVGLPIGLQILAAADVEALAVAHAAGLDFIRTECFAFAHVADEGIMESNAARLLRYRRAIGATGVQVWADIKKKHSSHAWTADLSLGDVAEAAEFMGADTLIVTGGEHRATADAGGRGGGAGALPVAGVRRVGGDAGQRGRLSRGVGWNDHRFLLQTRRGLVERRRSRTRARLHGGSGAPATGAGQPPQAFVPPVVPPRAPGSTQRIAIPPFPQQPR